MIPRTFAPTPGPSISEHTRRLAQGALLLGLCLLAQGAPALETRSVSGPVEVRVELSPDEPVIGDPMILYIEALAEPGVEVLMPAFGEALDRFRIVDFVPRESLTPDGQTLHSQRYTLQVPSSGEHTLPPILVEFVDHRPGQVASPDDLDAYEILTESLPFQVASVVPDSASADLSPPMEALSLSRGNGVLWQWILGGGFLLALASVFFVRAWRNWSAKAAVRTAWQMADSELQALLSGPLPQGVNTSAFFVELSGIVRRYLENRFSVRSPELTTERFLEEVSGSPDLGRPHQLLLQEFLSQCDLVKFAHVVPSPDSVRETIRKARRFVDETRDDAEAPGSPSVSSSSLSSPSSSPSPASSSSSSAAAASSPSSSPSPAESASPVEGSAP